MAARVERLVRNPAYRPGAIPGADSALVELVVDGDQRMADDVLDRAREVARLAELDRLAPPGVDVEER